MRSPTAPHPPPVQKPLVNSSPTLQPPQPPLLPIRNELGVQMPDHIQGLLRGSLRVLR